MGLTAILLFCLAALAARWLVPPGLRLAFILLVSLAALFALQPSSPVRGVQIALPVAAIVLTAAVWAITRPAPTAPPPGETAAPGASAMRLHRLAAAAIWLLIVLLVVLKTPALAQAAAAGMRRLAGQNPALASPLDLQWLGFSYLAFRLLHALRESQATKLPAFSLPEFAAYALFFPAYTAGPIDRAPRFISDLRANLSPAARPAALPDTIAGAQRILVGIFKKFVLADSLALFALSPQNAGQVQSAGWAWVMLLGYTLRIYFDFSGYTDIAIGLGCIIGLKLPENFSRPYLQPDLTAFWNSWHITLAQWFRAYYFNPLTRWLRSRPRKPSIALVVFITQLSTMILIGLWHGVSLNFLLWGAWHGGGLFIHNRFNDWMRPRQEALDARPRLQSGLRLLGWAATFVFVMLGWVWFALPDFPSAIHFFNRLLQVL